jgi:hypothetical protein
MIRRNVAANPHLEVTSSKSSFVAVRPLQWGTDDWKNFVAPSSSSGDVALTNPPLPLPPSPPAVAPAAPAAAAAAVPPSLVVAAAEVAAHAIHPGENNPGSSNNNTAAQQQQPHPDLILLADCVYWPVLFAPLVETLKGLCAPPPPPSTPPPPPPPSSSSSTPSRVLPSQQPEQQATSAGATVLMAHTRRWKKVGRWD